MLIQACRIEGVGRSFGWANVKRENTSNIRILVVDDEQGLRDLLSYELGIMGFMVQTASDGVEAVEMVEKQKFDLVISDIKMPRMDGLAALEQIKKIDPNIEVIMATGFGTIDMAVRAMKKGAYDFIQKPYNLEEMGLLIEKALEKSDLRALIALYECSRTLFSTINLKELLKIVMDLIQKVLQADEGSLMLLNKDNKLYIASSIGIEKIVADKVYLNIGERIAGRAAAERREMLLINGLTDYPEFSGIDINFNIGSSIVIPLAHQDELLGVLNLNRISNRDNFNSSDLRNASIFASQVTQAVQNAKMYQTLENNIEELKAAHKMLEETKDQLVESEKLASIGRLVAGVAHELNNPLTSVIGYTDLLIQSDIQGEAKKQLVIIFKEAERCRTIIQDLLVFARRREPVFEQINLNTLIRETIESLSVEISKNCIEVIQKSGDQQMIIADACQLKQVFMNILTNAMHALASVNGEKKVTISVHATKRDFVKVSFSDNGPGIEEKNLSKIFEPFFSTKGVGKGTGLGLSLSYGIIKQHGGSISVRSKQGQGATFDIEIPLKAGDIAPSTKTTDKTSTLAGKMSGKRILIVEDEEVLKNFLSHVMSIYGFQAETAVDGADALVKLEKNDFDIVLSDFLMPKMDGAELYEKTKVIKPLMVKNFIYMTGNADKELINFFKVNQLLYIMKPFRPNELIPLFQKIFVRF